MNFPRNIFIENARLEGHSDGYITDALNYIESLSQKNLPVIFSLKHFSTILNIDYKRILSIIHSRDYHYSYYLIKKKNGGFRRIIAPHKPIRFIQEWIKSNILDYIEVSVHAMGFVKVNLFSIMLLFIKIAV
jgi:hypothetical protein